MPKAVQFHVTSVASSGGAAIATHWLPQDQETYGTGLTPWEWWGYFEGCVERLPRGK